MKNEKPKIDLISFEEAYGIVMNSAFETGKETIDFKSSLDRVLRADIRSDIDMPPFNKASVDGFACRRADIGTGLEVIETIPAGFQPVRKVLKGQCSRIMTGAAIPDGADMVIMVEDSVVLPSGKVRCTAFSDKDNIAARGEDVKNGDLVIGEGTFIKPQHIAIMASAGRTFVTVSKRPQVAVISSGSELVEPEKQPGLSQIRNTNAYQLLAQVKRSGADGKYYGIARDDEEVTYKMVSSAISMSDLVLISGGVSMGDFDFVPSVLERAGVQIKFSRVKVQPGKPTTFGIHPKALVFGLPGNPVASFIQFELLVRPLLCKMAGYKWEPVVLDLQMNSSFSRKSADRSLVIPVIITSEGKVSPVEYHGSAHIAAYANASGIITLPEGKKSIERGEMVSVRQL